MSEVLALPAAEGEQWLRVAGQLEAHDTLARVKAARIAGDHSKTQAPLWDLVGEVLGKDAASLGRAWANVNAAADAA